MKVQDSYRGQWKKESISAVCQHKVKDSPCVGVHGLLQKSLHICAVFSKHSVAQKAYNWMDLKLEIFQMSEAKG